MQVNTFIFRTFVVFLLTPHVVTLAAEIPPLPAGCVALPDLSKKPRRVHPVRAELHPDLREYFSPPPPPLPLPLARLELLKAARPIQRPNLAEEPKAPPIRRPKNAKVKKIIRTPSKTVAEKTTAELLQAAHQILDRVEAEAKSLKITNEPNGQEVKPISQEEVETLFAALKWMHSLPEQKPNLRRIRNALALSHRLLARHIISEFKSGGMDQRYLMEAAEEAIARSIKAYEPTFGTFNTYAGRSIQNGLKKVRTAFWTQKRQTERRLTRHAPSRIANAPARPYIPNQTRLFMLAARAAIEAFSATLDPIGRRMLQLSLKGFNNQEIPQLLFQEGLTPRPFSPITIAHRLREMHPLLKAKILEFLDEE